MQQEVREQGGEHLTPWHGAPARTKQEAFPTGPVAPLPFAGLQPPGGALSPEMSHTFANMFGAGTVAAAGPSAFAAPTPASAPAVEADKPKIPGLYPGVEDLTGTYGGLAHRKRASTQGVVLHRTESSTAANTLGTYTDRIKKGSSIAAQYLIDENGQTKLVTPEDAMVSHAQGWSDSTVGIEVVGPGVTLDPAGTKKPLRKQVEGLTLPPEFKERLLGYDDKALAGISRANDNTMYEDVTGPQKRSVWNLTNELAHDHNLDMTSLSQHGKGDTSNNTYTKKTLPAFSAHEHINPKSLGEGEPMIEFLRTRQQYPGLVAAADTKLQQLIASGAAPADIEKQSALVQQNRSTLAALNLDNTPAERAALKTETDAHKPGEASAREQQRVDFYEHFYDRVAALKPPAAAPKTP